MTAKESSTPNSDVAARTSELFREHQHRIYCQTDRMFVVLMVLQWMGGIVMALVISPRTWIGATPYVHLHVWAAIFLGGAISSAPIIMGVWYPGTAATRHVIAIAQAAWSALLIHLSGGRIETHFHVFGSLAFLAVYRDWRVLITASAVVAVDHIVRGIWWPQSVYGVLMESPFRWIEHAAWVVFEDVVLILSCLRGEREGREICTRRAVLEVANAEIEQAHGQLEREMAEQKKLQCELAQAQKLESVGQLAAGIAHEINTPTQYVGDNIRFLRDAFGDLDAVLKSFRRLLEAARNHDVGPEFVAEADAAVDRADLEYLAGEIPSAIEQSLDGVVRVASIVRAMKEFSHPGTDEKSLVHLHEALQTTITVARNEWKYVAEVETDFDPQLPPVPCLPGEMNQVYLNLIVNAAHAIAEKIGVNPVERGLISVSTRRDGDWVEISIRDTGGGIPGHVQARIFDPFFTTKEVGKGTGQGLAIARSVVVDKHGGTMEFETAKDAGTTFRIRLPLAKPDQATSLNETSQTPVLLNASDTRAEIGA